MVGVLVMGVGIYRAILQQVIETAFTKTLLVAIQQVRSQTINCDLQNQPDVLVGLCMGK